MTSFWHWRQLTRAFLVLSKLGLWCFITRFLEARGVRINTKILYQRGIFLCVRYLTRYLIWQVRSISVDPYQPAFEGAVRSRFTQIASPSQHLHSSLVKQVSVKSLRRCRHCGRARVREGGNNQKLKHEILVHIASMHKLCKRLGPTSNRTKRPLKRAALSCKFQTYML